MPELIVPTAHIRNFGFAERFKVSVGGRFPTIIDTDNLKWLESSVEEEGFGYIRAQLPKKYREYDPQNKQYFETSRNIMLRITKELDGTFKLYRVPGLHVVTGSASYGGEWDAFSGFRQILTYGFKGGPYQNVYLPEEDYMHTLVHYGYQGNPEMDLKVTADRPEVEGDMYKVLLWTGFTRNYSESPKVDGRKRNFSSGTVDRCEIGRVQPFIVLKEGADITQRIAFYEHEIPKGLPNKVRMFDSTYNEIHVFSK